MSVVVCLVIQQSTEPEPQAFYLRWQGRGLSVPGPLNLILPPGTTIASSMFFLGLTVGPDVCEGYGVQTPCSVDTGCVLRLGPVQQTLSSTSQNLIDFRRDGVCQREQPNDLPAAMAEGLMLDVFSCCCAPG